MGHSGCSYSDSPLGWGGGGGGCQNKTVFAAVIYLKCIWSPLGLSERAIQANSKYK